MSSPPTLPDEARELSRQNVPQTGGQPQGAASTSSEIESKHIRQDAELFDLWAAGDHVAGTELFERHFGLVYRFFRSKVSTEVDDLVQQTFVACLEAQARYRREASFRTFLLAIARYELFEHYRKAASANAVDSMTTSVAGLSTSPSGLLTRHDDRTALLLALQKLPLDLQIALELAYWEGLDGPDMAVVLEIPLNTVYSRLRRAKELLREALSDEPLSRDARVMLEDCETWASRVRGGVQR